MLLSVEGWHRWQDSRRIARVVVTSRDIGDAPALHAKAKLLDRGAMDMTSLTGGKPGGGSEDFAFVSHEVPTVSMFLRALQSIPQNPLRKARQPDRHALPHGGHRAHRRPL